LSDATTGAPASGAPAAERTATLAAVRVADVRAELTVADARHLAL
jgi:hypothetical protein